MKKSIESSYLVFEFENLSTSMFRGKPSETDSTYMKCGYLRPRRYSTGFPDSSIPDTNIIHNPTTGQVTTNNPTEITVFWNNRAPPSL